MRVIQGCLSPGLRAMRGSIRQRPLCRFNRRFVIFRNLVHNGLWNRCCRGVYDWLNMRNNGYGDTAVGFPTPPQFYPDGSLGIGGAVEGGYGGDSRQWVWYVRIVPVSFLSPTLGITQEWTAQPWGSISGENSFLPFYCDGPYDYTCGDSPHGTLTVDVVWRLSNNGDVIGTSQIVIGKRSGGGAFLVLEQAHDNIW